MTPVEPLLKTQQLASALGVSMSTVKRWVDAGALKSTRTMGKHRLVALGDAIRFARAHDLPTRSLQRFNGTNAPAITVVDDVVRDSLLQALREGQAEQARLLIGASYAAAGNAAKLADDLIRPVMESLGSEWNLGHLDIYQEHRASRIVEGALMGLLGNLSREDHDSAAPLAIGCCPNGDHYTLAGLLCELTLREMGWEVINLGPNLPLSSFAKAVVEHRPQLAWLSIAYLEDRDQFVRDYRVFHEVASQTQTAVCVGGSALDPQLRSRIVAGGFGDRVSHLAEFARTIRRTTPPPNLRPRTTETDPTNPEPRD